MSPPLWRFAAVVAIVLSLAVVCGDALHRGPGADFGFRAHAIAAPGPVRYRLDTVTPGGVAARAGLRPGDIVALARDTYAERVHYVRLRPGDSVDFRIDRAAGSRFVTLTASASTVTLEPLANIYDFVRVTLLAVAGLIVLRRPERADARSLANFFIAFAFVLDADGTWLPSWTTLPVQVAFAAGLFYAVEQTARFATLFPVPAARGIRAAIARINPVACAAFVAVSASFPCAAIGFGTALPSWLGRLAPLGWLYFTAATTVAFVVGLRSAAGEDRQRARWVSLSLALGFSGLVVLVVCGLLGRTDPWLRYLPLTTIAIPLGTGYAILRHRVMDIGFALNRALVFTALSATVIVAFSVMEWLIGRYLTSAGHVTSAVLELGVALAVGLSLERIHRAIDRFVDDVFFRERHRAVRMLGRLTVEAAFVTDAATLLERVHATLVSSLHVRGCAVYLATGHGAFRAYERTLDRAPASLDENDALVVTLRAFRTNADADDVPGMPGDCAFPMIVRGELVGAVLTGRKTSDEALAPDERSAVASLALAIGNAIDALRVRDLRRAVADVLSAESTFEGLQARLRLADLADLAG